MSRRLILFAHGSSDPLWRRSFERLTQRISRQIGSGPVRLAYMQSSPPDLHTAVEEAQREGVRRILILPLFLFAGGHVGHDVPLLVDRARSRFPGTHIDLLPPVGEDERFAAFVEGMAREALEISDVPR